MKLYLLLFSFSSLLIISCCCRGREELFPAETLPPLTTEGKGTFGCMANGKLWLPSGRSEDAYCYYYDSASYPGNYGTFSVSAFNVPSSVSFQLKKRVFSTGRYDLYMDTTTYNIAGFVSEISLEYYPRERMKPCGELNIIRLDTSNRIISGTFRYDVINWRDITDTVKIRDGRFDLRYR